MIPIDETTYLLSCLAEECAEVIQRVTKAIRFGLSEVQPGQLMTNAKRIENELDDLCAVVEMLQEEYSALDCRDHKAMTKKKAKVREFMHYSVSVGALIEGGK